MRSMGSSRPTRCPVTRSRTPRPLLVLRLDLYVVVGLLCERPRAGCITRIVYFIDHLGVFCVSNDSNLRGLLQRSYKSAYRGYRPPCTRKQAREGSACVLYALLGNRGALGGGRLRHRLGLVPSGP